MASGARGGERKKLIAAVEALYWKAPTAASLAGTAYRVSDFPEPVVEVWDEHWEALMLFRQFSSQWRFGMNGPAALDLNVFQHALDKRGVSGDDYAQIMDDLSVIEGAALTQIHKTS